MGKNIHFVKVDEKIELAYQFINLNQPTKPILVFLHEGLGSFGQWKDFPIKLCNKLGLDGLIYERYGYGHSTPLQETRTSDYLDIEGNYFLPKVIQELKLDKREIILIGHSDGASIALIYASLFSKQIKYVISIAAHVFNEQISVDSIKRLKKQYQSSDKLKRIFEKYHFNHTDSTFYAFADTITHSDFKNWNIEHYLKNITAPIFAIQGFDDEYGTEIQVDSIITNSKSKYNKKLMIPDCGHSPHIQMTDFIVFQIADFYKSVEQINSGKTIEHEPSAL
ncbi:MAG: alpha/beta hydrolase [Flavobacteriales bacterium]|nr:alpha/beta hydrolase [Flavobacteriales bacterium]